MADLEKNKPTRTFAKILKVRTYSISFQQKKPSGQKPFMCRVGEVVYTDE
jgi:hypothetical protein